MKAGMADALDVSQLTFKNQHIVPRIDHNISLKKKEFAGVDRRLLLLQAYLLTHTDEEGRNVIHNSCFKG